MNNDIVEQCAKKLNIHPRIVFTFAYFYVEKPCSRANSLKEYVAWCKTGKYSVSVEQMCLDVLAGRVEIIDKMPAIVEYQKKISPK